MDERGSDEILIVGAGMAGLTAALAFAAHGRKVRVFEQAPRIEEVGAGLQVSPNATHILRRLGVLDTLLASAVRPEAVVLKDAVSLRELARVPLGEAAERRWGAPYLVAHRADLQDSLLSRAVHEPGIRIATGARVTKAAVRDGGGATVSVETDGTAQEAEGSLLVGADGVWSTVRGLDGAAARSRFAGEIAWRTMLPADSRAGAAFASIARPDCVTTFLHPGFHLVAYPVRGGAAFNLVAFTRGERIAEGWSGHADPAVLSRALGGTASALARLGEDAGPWMAWPLHRVDQSRPWTRPEGVALIGDAAHAMTPFAAQGAAMAIEDAATLADRLAAFPGPLAEALAGWERMRRPRVAKAARRGALNHLAWHAAGPVALARNLFLGMRRPESLAADLDWLYGWRAADGSRQ